MDDTVIFAEGLAKRYAIGAHRPERYTALRDVVAATVNRIGRRQRESADPVEDFWALKNVSFACERGDVIGIIGRNGAGKSTLLKILSRITEPSEGRVKIKGRVASLLEVGTGFHPELTGRENIYLNGAILGMKRTEIKSKFDEIVAFAEVERFLDTPVKRYSSGMYVRLAFAVAAHLEPEILVVDEVLAVGDAEFQQKCLGRMRHVAGEGRTVLFVSHNLAAIRSLCNRGLLLAGGRVVCDGSVDAAIRQYVSTSSSVHELSFAVDPTRPSIISVAVNRTALAARDVIVDIAFSSPRRLQTAVGGIVLRAHTGEPVWGSNSRFHPGCGSMKGLTSGVLRCEARQLPICNGTYHVSAWLGEWHEDHDAKLDVLSIQLGEDAHDPLRPPASAQGYLDWPAMWSADPCKDASAA